MAEYLTVSQAAARLGLSERTVQRRCKSGQLSARLDTTPDGAQWLIDPATLPTGADTNDTTADKVPTAKQVQNAPNPATGADTLPTLTTALPTGADSELLAHLRTENSFLRGLVEQRDRDAAELRAALRKALDAMPKALASGSTPDGEKTTRENDLQAPQTASGDQTGAPDKQSAQRGAKQRKLNAWQRIAARILRIR